MYYQQYKVGAVFISDLQTLLDNRLLNVIK